MAKNNGERGESHEDDDLPLGEDDAVKTPDVPGTSGGKAAALQYRSREQALQSRTGGFFTIYKKGQGYWTRMGTAIAAAGLGMMTAYVLYDHIPAIVSTHDQALARKIAITVAGVFLVAYALFVYWLSNKPQNVDFLIATDSEMKKVNWTSRKELIGSTKVVIVFMFVIAVSLFLIDIFFGYLFYLVGVLKSGPFAS